MGTGSIPTRNSGDVILDNFFNDLRAKWIGDVVGLDTNGNPVAGNNLGNSAFPFGKLYVRDQILLGGSALDLSQLETQPYKIVSGRKRSTSNQADFIRAAGSSVNFTILATTTNLILQIAGVVATWTADKIAAGTVAPSTQNTAVVADATAVAQAATRTWGEYGSGSTSSYYPITMISAGTNITSKVGTWQAFKIGTEYFLAYVDSTTQLSHAFRGFFLDSSGNPVKRAPFSDGSTITLMSLGWVFLDQDLTTVDVTYNNPAYSYTAPSSPATGDYWFDEGSQVWKRYGGSSWALVNRTLVGLVVLDGTNCVATRSFDFFGLVRSDNTIEIERTSNTVVKSSGLFQRANVNGKRITFGTSRAVWNTAANLAASTERYNATVQASSTEYLYVTDDGNTKISDMEPYFRPDLFGWYHPYNSWRNVGSVITDGSANFSSASVVPPPLPFAGISRKQLPALGQQTSSTSGSNVNTTTWTDVVTAPAVNVGGGRGVLIMLVPDGDTGNGADVVALSKSDISSNPDCSCSVAIARDGTRIALFNLGFTAAYATTFTPNVNFMRIPPGAILFIDTSVTPGSRTYKLQSQAGNYEIQVNHCKLVAFEL